MTTRFETCPGCLAELERSDGPVHRYIGASAACWGIYCEVLAREYEDPQYGIMHRLTVDAYSAQHPGVPSTQSQRSVAIHLIGLRAVIEEKRSLKEALGVISRAAGTRESFRWLEPPSERGSVTIVDVRRATTPEQHAEVVEEWARSVWHVWSPHHETIARWARAGL